VVPLAKIELPLAADLKQRVVAVSAVGFRLCLSRSTVRFHLFALFHSVAAMTIVAATLQRNYKTGFDE